MIAPVPHAVVVDAVARALAEDLGGAGDVTSAATIGAGVQARAILVARAAGVIAGLPLVVETCRQVDAGILVGLSASDGDMVEAGAVVATLTGPAQGILTAERTALNFVGHLSGIATATRRLVDAVAGTRARIADTRKTTPGLRALEKYAVRCGGGVNHRFGLDDAVLIKDNHIVAAGGVGAAVRAARTHASHMVTIEVEVDTLAQLDEALDAGAQVVLLDNMSPADLAIAVMRIGGRAVAEASGGITLEGVRAVAEAGVDVISSGWITHSAPRLDVALDVVSNPRG
ncbi:MAG: carboxylating nicotinate-nucleotide diphosphorylase [Acidobacteria bacterium]|nr:carboxylating nicotinate-nucleotide diphosphorylase [Acidobacteriota bacterium]